MSEFDPQSAVARTSCTLTALVAEEEWGALWRGTHPEKGNVLVVIYGPSVGGLGLYDEAAASLQQWERLASGGTAPGLLKIYQVAREENVVVLVAEDPGGRFLGEFAGDATIGLKDMGRCFAAIARSLIIARAYEIPFVGLTMFGAVEDKSQKDFPWRLLPIAPGARRASVLAAGRYAPPELADAASLPELNADSYSLARLWVDVLAQDNSFDFTKEKLREVVPYPRLRTMLNNGLTPAKGAYGDPKLTQIAIDRWLKEAADEDLKEVKETADAAGRSVAQQKLHENKGLLAKVGIGLAAVAVLVLLVMAVPAMFRSTNTNKTPYGTLNLYFAALAKGDTAGAKSYTMGEATPQTDNLKAEIERMEKAGLASKFGEGVPQVHGDGDVRTVKADLKGENHDLFMNVEMTIRKQPMTDWKIDTLFFKPLR
ncbi:hypothetical protein BH09SUM1_BH09SUM1_32020 [soil metagenome]